MKLTLTFSPNGTYQCPGLGATRDLAVRELGLDPHLEQRGCSDCPVFTSCKMSHWTTVDVAVTDEAALHKAAEELGCTWQIGGEAHGWNGLRTTGDFIIKLPRDRSPYDVAVHRKADKLSFKTDWYNDHVEKVVGKDYGSLLQLYGIHKAHAAARLKGYTTQRKLQPNGDIQLHINIPG